MLRVAAPFRGESEYAAQFSPAGHMPTTTTTDPLGLSEQAKLTAVAQWQSEYDDRYAARREQQQQQTVHEEKEEEEEGGGGEEKEAAGRSNQPPALFAWNDIGKRPYTHTLYCGSGSRGRHGAVLDIDVRSQTRF